MLDILWQSWTLLREVRGSQGCKRNLSFRGDPRILKMPHRMAPRTAVGVGWSHPGLIRQDVWDEDGRAGDVSESQMSDTELFTLLDFWFCFDLTATVP